MSRANEVLTKYDFMFEENRDIAPKTHMGVYVLYRDGEPVYIGKSRDVNTRVSIHMSEGLKVFDSWNYILMNDEGMMSDLEVGLILRINPIYNNAASGSKKYTTKPYKTSYRLGYDNQKMKRAINLGIFETFVFGGKVYYDVINIERALMTDWEEK